MGLRIVEEASRSDVGRQRSTNEDAFFESPRVLAVADGMGGARAGEVAARIAVESVAETAKDGEPAEQELAGAAHEANRRIYELAQEDHQLAGMGTTLTAVAVGDHDVAVGHVGDSRVYRFRDEELERLTDDHSLVEEMVRQGKLSPEEAEHHPQRSIITRALGPEPEVEVDRMTVPARDDDVFLICSDGLTSMVSEEKMAQVMRARSSLDQVAEVLVNVANEAGGRDNITVVLFRLGSDAAPAADQDTLTGQETAAVTSDEVREAVKAAGPVGAATQAPDATLAISPEEAAELRRREPPPAAPPPRRGRRRARRLVALLVVLLLVAAVGVGFWAGSRQFYFLGTSDAGLVTLYRGLPYDLPFGIELYREDYVSATPAQDVCRPRRALLTDHQLRERGDAVDLVRQIEANRLECG
jgi:protein phosphatase